MSFLIKHIRWIMILAGTVTSTLFYAALYPDQAMELIFGELVFGPLAEIIVRSWGVLIGLIGLSLIYGAINRDTRRLALLLAILSKSSFICIVLLFGQTYISEVVLTIAIDTVFVALFILYLILTRRHMPN